MKNITLIDKSSHNITSQFDGNKIINLTSKPTVIVLKHEIEIFEIKQENNQIVITLTNGEKIIVEGFFDADHSLVVQGSDQQLIWVQFTDQRGALLAEINYQPLEDIEPLLYDDHSILPWLLPIATAGGIVAWADHDKSKNTRPLQDSTKPEIQITIDENGVISIKPNEPVYTVDDEDKTNAIDTADEWKDLIEVENGTVSVDGNGNLVVTPTDPEQDVVVKLPENSVTDKAGNGNEEFGAEFPITTEPAVDTTAPTLESAKVTETGRVELEFSEAIDANHPPKAEDFTLTVDGETVAIQDVIIVGDKVTLVPVKPIEKDQIVELSYSDPEVEDDANALQDAAGNDVKDFTTNELADGVVNGSELVKPTEPEVDTRAPELESAKVTATGRVELTFDEAIDANNPPQAGDFALTVDGETVAIQDVIIAGEKVTLIPATPIEQGAEVNL
ncbi:BapA/Bap/LapF family prefix-like domain-containing protein, partial [Acinetobacter indicus]|uniref:BapA/Bap/LapF family prefix-like domain-containing protein n=1 Tax=Acinetobacter indicus TaxID=756892 RepID=UPI00149013FB